MKPILWILPVYNQHGELVTSLNIETTWINYLNCNRECLINQLQSNGFSVGIGTIIE